MRRTYEAEKFTGALGMRTNKIFDLTQFTLEQLIQSKMVEFANYYDILTINNNKSFVFLLNKQRDGTLKFDLRETLSTMSFYTECWGNILLKLNQIGI